MYRNKFILKIKILMVLVVFLFSIQHPTNINKEKTNSSLSKVTVNIANVRYKPDLKSKIIGRLKKNLLVQVISIDGDWAKISLKGFYFRKERTNRPWGFIHKPLIEPTDIKPLKVQGLGSVKIRYNHVNIRENSSASSKIIGSTRMGVIFGVLKRDKNWITVIIPELKNNKIKTGYIYSPLTEESKSKPFLFENKNIPIEKISKDVIIAGDISQDLTLLEGESYVFTGEVKKLKDVKLIIESGAIIDFKNCQLISEDKLSFKGSLKKPIIINTTLDKNKKKHSEIKSDKISFENCVIEGNLKIISKTKDSLLKIKDSKITGNIEILSFKNIELKRNNITNSLKGLAFIDCENILINDSLFLNNNAALIFINCKNIKIKFNTFHNNISTITTDIDTDLSDNFWGGELSEKTMNSISKEKNITIEPQLLYPSENAPPQMYEHVLYPEETDLGDIIELELFFNRDMDITSVPLIEINSEKNKKVTMKIQEQDWISSRSWFARLKLPKGTKPGQYKIFYSNIDSVKSASPVMIKSLVISVLYPALINIKSFKKNDRKFVSLNFSGEKRLYTL